ncbi:MAG: DUF3857 domain-containing transglutaminase family protein [Chryseolinea sp.]
MRLFICGALIFISAALNAADIKYPASEIPDALKKNMSAVVREDEVSVSIPNQRSLVLYAHAAVTILSAAGNDHASIAVGYDKLTKISTLRAAVYDATGKLIRRVKFSDFNDASSFEGLYSDDRAKYIDLTQGVFPYTVEYEYEIVYKFLFFVPGMNFIADENTSVQSAVYSIAYANGVKPRYYTHLINQKPVESTTSDGLSQISWKLNDLIPPARESFGPVYKELTPYIIAAPSQFEYEGYVGSMDTWDGFGKWTNTLLAGRQNLPEETKVKVRQLTAKATTTEEKARILYSYMQNRTRYVSVQLGIGGFQPFDAATVDKVGYGDCKALSNYMISLLDAVGVKSNYTLIAAGRSASPLKPDFTSSQFNHAIVAVPNGKDTLWLECTSQVNPFGYSGSFTGNRKAVVVTDNGAKVAYTPRYDARVNKQVRHAKVLIQDNGNATAKVSTVYSGMQYENGGLDNVMEMELDDQKKWIQKYTQIPSFEVQRFSMTDHKERIPNAKVDLDLTLNRYASVTGKRLFVPANLMNRFTSVPEKATDRKNPVILKTASTDIDTVEFSISESLYPEFVPDPIKHKSRFGEYEASVQLSAGKVIYIRKFILHDGVFPSESYSELVDFFRSVNRADNLKLVFLNKT